MMRIVVVVIVIELARSESSVHASQSRMFEYYLRLDLSLLVAL